MGALCRMEVLGASIDSQLLGRASAIQSAMDVHMRTVLGWLPVLHLQHLDCMMENWLVHYAAAEREV